MAQVCLEFNLLCCHATSLETPGTFVISVSNITSLVPPDALLLQIHLSARPLLVCINTDAHALSLSFSFSHCHSRTHSLKTLSHMFAGIAVLGSNLDHYIKLPTCRAKRRAALLQYLIRILKIFYCSYCNIRMPFSACASHFALVFRVCEYPIEKASAG